MSALEALKKGYVNLGVLILNVLVMFVLVNVVALLVLAVVDRLWPRRNAVAERHGLASQSDMYPGMSDADVNQLLKETWSRAVVFEPYTMFKEPASKGRFLNVDAAGFRVSADQGPWPPNAANYNVFLFGGSTTFSYGLPDTETLGSAFQAALATRDGRPVKVYNFGIGAYQSTQERVLFQELLVKGHRPQLAIFVDGLNDFAFPHQPMGTDQLRLMLEDTPGRRVIWLGSAVARRLPLVLFAEGLTARLRPAAASTLPLDEPSLREFTRGILDRYLSNKLQIDGVARQYGVHTAFVWQPVPFYKYDPALHPFKSDANRNVAGGYALLRTMLPADIGTNFLWCADMQEGLHERLYVDAAHYTARMSRRIAEFAVGLMDQRGLLATP